MQLTAWGLEPGKGSASRTGSRRAVRGLPVINPGQNRGLNLLQRTLSASPSRCSFVLIISNQSDSRNERRSLGGRNPIPQRNGCRWLCSRGVTALTTEPPPAIKKPNASTSFWLQRYQDSPFIFYFLLTQQRSNQTVILYIAFSEGSPLCTEASPHILKHFKGIAELPDLHLHN